MSIRGLTRVVAIALTLCLGFAGVSWSADDDASKSEGSVETAPPADAAEADTEEAASAEDKTEADAAE